MVKNILRSLDDEAYFVETLGAHFRNIDDYGGLLQCAVTVDDERLRWAHTEYQQGVSEFSIRLGSGDPDHYKRCGALLRALYRIKPITNVELTPNPEEVDPIFAPVGLSHADAEHHLSLGRLYDEFHNELTAFSYAYNVCAIYEDNPVKIDAKYLHTMCVYLASNDNLSADSLYMIFKSIMLA